MIHKDAEKFLSGFEKVNEYFGFDYIGEYEFHDSEIEEIRITKDNLEMKVRIPYGEHWHVMLLHFYTVNEISLNGIMMPIAGIEIYEQEPVKGWCVFGMDGNGGEIHCGRIECVSVTQLVRNDG